MNRLPEGPALAAAQRFGTPLYMYDLTRLRADARGVAEAFPDPWIRLYSLKANGLPALVSELAALGFGANAVSSGEIALARRAGVAPAQIALEGIGKTSADLALAAKLAAEGTPLLWVSLESAEDAAALAVHVTKRASGRKRVDVLVRVNPGVAPETHQSLAVGAPDAKFGISPEELPALIAAGGGPNGPLRWRGIHLHVGSQLGAVDAWRSAFRVGLRLLELQKATLPDFDTLDAGGGFPAPMNDADADAIPDAARFAQETARELRELPADARPKRLAIEPGRSLVAGSGWLIGRVLHVRDREPTLVVLDTGMTELIRPALYGAVHPMRALTSLGKPTEGASTDSTHVRVDGPICESTDTFGMATLPPLQRDDIVAIGTVGAYGSSMFSSYNGRPRPSEVAWDGERLSLLRRRGTLGALP
ncbi:MAG: diaminopimelate decarboxylase [Chloroflexota bacterium]|jgi:diaminopimelate decarboxylase|nr:diaminopimelate decarboxylase [Chloroflexota bacterium]